MRLQERTSDHGGGGGRSSGGNKENPQNFLPPNVAKVPPEVLKNFSHTKRVGNYLLGKTLGEGSFAKVKEGMHSLTGEKVAVKVIDKKKAREDAYVRKNLRREGKLLQMVRHRHVVKLFEIMETENSYYLVTELCKGGDLMEHICNKKRLDEKETRKYVRQILSAVDYLHKSGILHRDLKVENLLLDENKNVKIIDFGLSNAVEVSTGSNGATVFHEFCVTQCGSPAYAAPELLGNNKYGPSVDIWSISARFLSSICDEATSEPEVVIRLEKFSVGRPENPTLGVNMFAMLTGSLPFTVEPFNIKALHKKMQKGDMNSIPDHITQNCRDLMKKFLNPDPENRITIQEAMKHPWIRDGYTGAVEPAPFPNKVTREDLVADIVKHMGQNLDFKVSEIVRLVTGNIPNSATATYFLLAQRLTRHEAETQLQARIKRAAKMAERHMNSNFDITGNDVIELTPIHDREELDLSPSSSHRAQHRSQEPRVIDMNTSPRRLPKEPEDKPSHRATLTRANKYRHDTSREHSPARGGRSNIRETSPRRTAQGTRRGSMEHSPRASPRHSPRRTNPIRRGSLEPPRRGSLLPRSLSQETEGSSVAPSDIVLPDLDAEAEELTVGQAIHMQREGGKANDRLNQPRPVPFRHRSNANPPNLPSLNAFNTRSAMDTSASSPSPRPKTLTHLNPPREGDKYLAGRMTDRNHNKESGRLSPSLNYNGNNTQRVGLDLDNRKAHNCSSHSTASSIGRQSGISNAGVGGVGHGRGGIVSRPEEFYQGSHTKGEWRNVKPTNNRGNNQRVINTNDVNASDMVNGKILDSISKKLVFDTGQYDRYARASGRIRTIAHPQPPPADYDNTYLGGQKKLISLMYPSQNHRPRHVVPSKGQSNVISHQTNNQSSYHHNTDKNNTGTNYMNSGDNFLGVTGERASGGNGGRVGSGIRRQYAHQNQQLSPIPFQAETENISLMGRDHHRSVSPVHPAPSRSPSPSYLRGCNNQDKVALPAISPTLGLSSYSGRIQIEDLDRQ